MAEPKLRIILEAVDNVSGTLKSVGGAFETHRKQIGMAMTVAGGVITGAMGLMVKAAADEEAGIQRLRQALQNAGVDYDANVKAIEGVIAAQQAKTTFGDGPQREALSMLVSLTGNYDEAMKRLTIAMDLSAGTGMDLATTSQLMGRITDENINVLSRYGIKLGEGATATDLLAAVTQKFGGQAAAAAKTAAGQFAQLNNTMGDLQEDIGKQLLPILRDVLAAIGPIIKGVSDWLAANPELARVIILVVAALGGMMLILGPLLLMLPGLIAGFSALGVAITLATGPIGLIVLGVVALIAGIILLWKNWDTVWGAITGAFETVSKFILGLYEGNLGWLLPGGPLVKALLFLRDNWEAIWTGMRDTLRPIVNGMMGMAEALANAFIGMANAIIRALNSIQVTIPDWVPGIGGRSFGLNLPLVPSVVLPRLAEGGIVTRPTLALIGERGPEAVIPLGKGMGLTIVFNAPVYGMTDFRRAVAQAVRDAALGGAFHGVKIGG